MPVIIFILLFNLRMLGIFQRFEPGSSGWKVGVLPTTSLGRCRAHSKVWVKLMTNIQTERSELSIPLDFQTILDCIPFRKLFIVSQNFVKYHYEQVRRLLIMGSLIWVTFYLNVYFKHFNNYYTSHCCNKIL